MKYPTTGRPEQYIKVRPPTIPPLQRPNLKSIPVPYSLKATALSNQGNWDEGDIN